MQEDISVTRTAVKYGLIFGIASGVYTILLYITESEQNKVLPWIGFALLLTGIVLGIKEYRKLNDGFMSYGQGIGLGTLIGAISGFCSAMLGTFYTQVIDNTPLQRGLDATRQALEERGMDDAQIDNVLEMTQKFQSPGIMFAMGVVMTVIVGLIASLIIAALFKKSRPVFE